MPPPPRNPLLGEAVNHLIDARLEDVHVRMPGRVMSYDAAKQTVDVQPGFRKFYEGESGPASEPYAVLRGVPVKFPGSGPYRITWPIQANETGDLEFHEASFAQWKMLGSEGGGDSPRFHLADAVFVPGLRPANAPLTDAPLDAASFGHDTGPQFRAKATQIELGSNKTTPATEALVLGSTYRQQETQVNSKLSAALAQLLVALPAISTAVGATAAPGSAAASTALTAVLVPVLAAIGQAQAQLAAMEAAAATYLSTVVKGR